MNGITDALRRHGGIQWVPVCHEEVAAFAAGAEAALTGNIAVCAGSAGPGNLHLINGLFDCHRNRVPVFVIAAHIPSTEIGTQYFQATHPEVLFKECSHYAELISDPRDVPRIVEIAIREAVTKRGVAVIVISGDTALSEAAPQAASENLIPHSPTVIPSSHAVEALADFLNAGDNVTLLCGAGCAGAHDEVIELASRLKAPIVHTLRGKEYLEWGNLFDVGMTGLIGFASGYHAMLDCDTLLLLGTDFPYRQFYPQEARIAQLDIRGEHLGNRCRLNLGVIGDVKATLGLLVERITEKLDKLYLERAVENYRKTRADLDALAALTPGRKPIHPQTVARLLSERATEDAIFTCDVGEPTVWAARHLSMNGKRRLLGSFLHGSMANAMPQAIGAQVSNPDRQVISLSGDGGFSMLMGDVLTLRSLKLPIKVVIFNNESLGFVDLEMKAAGLISSGTRLDNPNFAEMARAIGIFGVRVEDPGELDAAIQSAFAHDGPAIIDVLTDASELVMPPKVNLEQVKGFSVWMMKAVLNGEGNQIVHIVRSALAR